MSEDPFAVLGVSPTADLAEIRRAYLAQMRVNHPDVRPDDATAQERTRALNVAWAQVRARRTGGAGSVAPGGAGTGVTAADRHRARRAGSTRARVYSERQRAFRVAFTAATLRAALVVLALGMVLLAAFAR